MWGNFTTYFIAEKSFVSDSKLFVYGNTSSVSELKSLALQYGVSLPGGGDKSNFDSPELFDDLVRQSKEIGVSAFTGFQTGSAARLLKRARNIDSKIITMNYLKIL